MLVMLDIFTSLSVPYLIDGSSLLQLYRYTNTIDSFRQMLFYHFTFYSRNYSVATSDLDFSVPLSWWTRNNNSKIFSDILLEKGFKKKRTFGEPDKFGYEERWTKDSVDVDIFSSVVRDGVHSTGLWVEEELYRCSYPLTGVREVTVPMWGGRKVRLQSPMEPVLVAMFGPNWRQPDNNWRWNVDPFLIGYCK